ncbi:MAG: 2OG-Fe(II) oxygenase [Gammaproteobacteria bacterium]|nr:2OG-Fe(II) oxygenase [Gammaproteobacteria bacterium]
MSFKSKEEIEISNSFISNGYVINRAENQESLVLIRSFFSESIRKKFKDNTILNNYSDEELLNNFHTIVEQDSINDLRVDLINQMNSEPSIREHYYSVAKNALDLLVGNEIAMQLRINLSIQLPNDDTSLLPVHADTWSGDSPFELVVWIPLVHCYKTKAMFLLPPEKAKLLYKDFKKNAGKSTSSLFNSIKNQVDWIHIDFGDILIFNQSLPHGNIINNENETRWSLNCRFKGTFTPYGDKKLGEFFEPINLKAASILGLDYELPK